MQLFIRRHTSVRYISFSTATLAYTLKECLQKMTEIKHETAQDLYVIPRSGSPVDSSTYARLLEECIHLRSLRNGKLVHTHIITNGFEKSMFLGNQLLNMYAKCGSLEDASQVFDKMSERNLDTWTMLIVAYAQSKHSEDIWKLFCQMKKVGLEPNRVALISVIKACAVTESLERCKQIHVSIFHAGFHSDAFVACALVNLYAKCGSIEDARQVFDRMAERDVVSWVAMVAGCTQNGCEGEALNLFCQMQREGTKANYFIVSSLLSACANLLALECAEQVHAYAIKAGFDSEISVVNALVTMYARCGILNKAQCLFDEMHRRDVISWNAVISGYAQRGNGFMALQLFAQMHREDMKPNHVTFASVLSASANAESLEEGRQVHGDAIKAGYVSDVLVGGAIVDMYAKCGNIQGARLAFDKTSKKNVVLWNVMLVGYGQSGKCEESFELFRQMQWAGMKPNQFTFPSILRTCASLTALEEGEQIHTHIIKTGFDSNVFVGSVLVDVYAKCGSIENARLVLDNMPERDMVSWTAMIAGYAQHEYGKEALQLFEEMQLVGMKRDHITFASALSACASLEALEQGKQLHAHLVKNGFDSDVSVGNTLVTMYAKCGRIGDASNIFNEMSEHNVISWNAMIAGYAQGGHGEEALQLFYQMLRKGMKANQFTYPCAVSACANLANLEQGKQVHAQIIKTGIDSDIPMRNAIVTLYAKCGNIEDAQKEFDKMLERSVVSWNAMIAGYAQHGHGIEALQLFEHMQKEGIKANHITFVAVLSACSHIGLVDEGRKCFNSMECDYGIPPRLEHYACMVDILGRAGCLNEAEDFINQMPVEPDSMVWRTLLGACTVHGNLLLGERAARCLIELEPQDSATYVLLSNIYVAAGRLDDAEKVRNIMKEKGVKKVPGRSWVETKDKVHAFFVGDRLHPQTDEIWVTLERLTEEIKAAGYVPENKFMLNDRDQEQNKYDHNYHSEKLAIAFGLISTSPGMAVRVMKNLRMCSDCHTATKFISKVVGREIVVRDANRYHHFRDGLCTCGDYW